MGVVIKERGTRLIFKGDPHALSSIKQILGVYDKNTLQLQKLFLTRLPNDMVSIPRNIKLSVLQNLSFSMNNSVLEVDTNTFIPYDKVSLEWNDEYVPRDKTQEQVEDFLKNNDNAVVNVDTGTGKTFTALRNAYNKQVRTIIIIERLDIGKQWVEKINAYFKINPKRVLVLNSSDKIEKIISGNLSITKYDFIISTYRTMGSYYDKFGSSQLEVLFKKLRVGMKITDEAHKSIYSTFKIDSSVDVRYNIYLTATAFRSNKKEAEILKFMLPTNTFVKMNTKQELYHTVMMEKYTTIPDPITVERIEGGQYGFNISDWCEYIVLDINWKFFKEKIFNVLSRAYSKAKFKTMIVVHEIAMVERLVDDLMQDEFFSKYRIGNYSGAKKSKDVLENSDIIVATLKSVEDALDTFLEILINTCNFTNKVGTKQLTGRLRRNSTASILVDIADHGFPQLQRQQMFRKRQYKVFAKKLFEIK